MSADPELDILEQMAAYYFVDRRARVAPNAWADLPVCPCGGRIGPGDQCARCKSTFADLKRGEPR